MIINLGCGNRKSPKMIGVDINPLTDVDIIADLSHFPYPFKDDIFDKVICNSILEHIDDLVNAIREIHRISKNGAQITITGPHFSSSDFYADPTHKRAFSSRTFNYFINPNNPSIPKLELISFTIGIFDSQGFLRNLFKRFINKHINFYEKHFAFILPTKGISFRLKVMK
ncbi:methyltransferase domain-containing protein [candidate division WOR-3 bacterium]|nr:methyltransferase domain-containing protein [candidate division WOR-3 bacterium]